MKNNPRRSRISVILMLVLAVTATLAITGCQEDRGQTRADSANAADNSSKRLDNAVSSFQNTLGQNSGPADTGRPTLRWEPPATREDGSRLLADDIKEYRVYYRLRYQASFKRIGQPASNGTRFELDRFESGAYEFSVTAVDTEGRESQRSDAVSVDLI